MMKHVAIVEQRLDQLDEPSRTLLNAIGAGGPLCPIVDRSWVFDSISWFEARPWEEYPVAGEWRK